MGNLGQTVSVNGSRTREVLMSFTTEIVSRVTNRDGNVSEVVLGKVVSDQSKETATDHMGQVADLCTDIGRTMREMRYWVMTLRDPQPEGSHD